MDDRKWVWDGRPWRAFKTFAIIFSFTMNLILLIVLLAVAPLILPTVDSVAKPIVGGLSGSFVDMGAATITRTIDVSDTMPINFTLPLSSTTEVIMTENVGLTGVPARFVFPNGGGAINGQVFLDLPEGLELPVQLNLQVPVSQTIPVQLAVGVEIPLRETELGAPFGQLQALFEPLDDFLGGLPASNEELFERITSRSSPVEESEPVGAATPQ